MVAEVRTDAEKNQLNAERLLAECVEALRNALREGAEPDRLLALRMTMHEASNIVEFYIRNRA